MLNLRTASVPTASWYYVRRVGEMRARALHVVRGFLATSQAHAPEFLRGIYLSQLL